jgi:hypothetical protein
MAYNGDLEICKKNATEKKLDMYCVRCLVVPYLFYNWNETVILELFHHHYEKNSLLFGRTKNRVHYLQDREESISQSYGIIL